MASTLKVYIAGPMTTSGDLMINIKNGIDLAEKIREAGHFPFVPHLAHFWHLVHPRGYDDWMDYDLNWLEVCDVMVRLPGRSKGADIEEKFALEKNIPVYSPEEFLNGFCNNSMSK